MTDEEILMNNRDGCSFSLLKHSCDEEIENEELWLKHIEEYPQIKTRSEEKRKGFKSGLAEGRKEVREHETTCINRLHFIEKENIEQKAQIEKMKSITEELIKIQSLIIEDDYNAGLFNGFVTVFNSIFEEKYQCCKWDENKSKWELAE